MATVNKIKDSNGVWQSFKVGDKTKDSNGIWQSLKNSDKMKADDGLWYPFGISPIIRLSANPLQLYFEFHGGYGQYSTITLTGSNQSWEIESQPSWVSSIKTNETNLFCSCDENLSGSTRYGDVVIRSIEDTNIKVYINLIQYAE